MNSSKSAFDFLMRNVKTKQQPIIVVEPKASIVQECKTNDDDDIILINNEDVSVKTKINNENNEQNIQKTFHVQQFSK